MVTTEKEKTPLAGGVTEHNEQLSDGSVAQKTGSIPRPLPLSVLDPIVSRVRTDVTALKGADGKPFWTREPLTPERLQRHLDGTRPRGCCPIKAGESTTKLALLDLDSHRGETPWSEMQDVANMVTSALESRGMRVIPFRSSGGKGIHLFMLWDTPQDAHSVRVFLRSTLAELGYIDGAGGVKRLQIEVFPKQDQVDADRWGSQFILPLAGKSEPLDWMLGLEPMGKEWATLMEWPSSPAVPNVEKPERRATASLNSQDASMACRALTAIPNDIEDRGTWLKLVCAFKEAAGEEGYQTAFDWTALHPSHDDEKFNKTWDSITIGRENGAPADYLYAVALRHGFNEHIATEFNDAEPPNQQRQEGEPIDVGRLFEDLALTQEDVSKMADAEFLIENLVVRGSLSVFVAPANGGKTTLFIHLCEELVAKGMQIFYINADASPSDLKRHHAHATRHGYVVLAPDAKAGKGPRDIIDKLKKLNAAGADLGSVVIVLDTLKKFTSVIEKKNMRDFLALMRGISTKGATIIMLAHTNKYVGDDGKHIFEGTGDLRNDVDHLIYLEGGKDETNRRQEITTRPDKVRANFKTVSYWIDLDTREVHRADRVLPVVSEDERAIAALATEAIRAGVLIQSAVASYIKEARPDIGEKKIRGTLHKLAHGEARIFNTSPGANNARLYMLRSQVSEEKPDLSAPIEADLV